MRIGGEFPNNYCINMKVIEFPFVSVRNERINCMVVLKILMPEPQPRPIKSQIPEGET